MVLLVTEQIIPVHNLLINVFNTRIIVVNHEYGGLQDQQIEQCSMKERWKKNPGTNGLINSAVDPPSIIALH